MKTQCEEGILLEATSFREGQQILTLFTENHGVIKLITKKGSSRQRGGGVSALSLGEFRYEIGKSDLFRCQDIHIIDSYLPLRSSLERLEAAGQMVQAIRLSQLLSKSAPKLYQLLVWFLNHLKKEVDAYLCSSSFLLKVLRHEGIWPPAFQCHSCFEALESGCFWGTEMFCQKHAPRGSIFMSKNEIAVLVVLTYARSLDALKQVEVSGELAGKVWQLFDLSYRKTMSIN